MLSSTVFSCNTEVDKFKVSCIFLEKHVLGLKVTMHYTFGMQIHQSLKKLTHNDRSSLLSYVFTDYFLEELASLAELKN